jgi:hypothetical protein
LTAGFGKARHETLAPQSRKAYLRYMHRLARKFAKPLAFLVVAAQLLLAVPAMAFAPVAFATPAEMPCDGMPTPASDEPCPCCPDGATSMTDCLVTCMFSAVTAPTIVFTPAVSTPAEAIVDLPYTAETLSDPPLKPPPIA